MTEQKDNIRQIGRADQTAFCAVSGTAARAALNVGFYLASSQD